MNGTAAIFNIGGRFQGENLPFSNCVDTVLKNVFLAQSAVQAEGSCNILIPAQSSAVKVEGSCKILSLLKYRHALTFDVYILSLPIFAKGRQLFLHLYLRAVSCRLALGRLDRPV